MLAVSPCFSNSCWLQLCFYSIDMSLIGLSVFSSGPTCLGKKVYNCNVISQNTLISKSSYFLNSVWVIKCWAFGFLWMTPQQVPGHLGGKYFEAHITHRGMWDWSGEFRLRKQVEVQIHTYSTNTVSSSLYRVYLHIAAALLTDRKQARIKG